MSGRDIDDRDDGRTEAKASDERAQLSASRRPGHNPDADSIHRGRLGDGATDDKSRRQDRELDGKTPCKGPLSCRRERVRVRNREYLLKPDDFKTMLEIGRFRTVTEDDLARFHFEGNASRMEYELRNLACQGLVRRHRIKIKEGRYFRAIVLTPEGKRLVEKERAQNGVSSGQSQQIYADLKKPTESAHDAAIYRMYQKEADRIQSSGGKIRRVVLDYELKKAIYAPLAKARQQAPETYAERQQEVARDNGLAVVEGKIPLPDLRIEYETRDGELAKVDLELATEHYREGQLAQKARAGFKLYLAPSSRTRSSSVWEDRELTAAILSL